MPSEILSDPTLLWTAGQRDKEILWYLDPMAMGNRWRAVDIHSHNIIPWTIENLPYRAIFPRGGTLDKKKMRKWLNDTCRMAWTFVVEDGDGIRFEDDQDYFVYLLFHV